MAKALASTAIEAIDPQAGELAWMAARLRAAVERMRHDTRTVHVAMSAERRELFILGVRAGLSISRACKLAGIAERTVYRERGRNEAFAVEWAEALEGAIEPLEDRLEEIAYTGDMSSMATVRAAETLLRGRSARYRQGGPAPQRASASVNAATGTISVSVGTPTPD